jgi:hypothetical protein
VVSIDWRKFASQHDFDRVVEAFFVKEYKDESGDTYAVNGIGGDGGIDIHIRHADKFIIAQLKFFPEGFSGGWKKVRQNQIRASYSTALQHDPDEWWLVVPTTLKPGERTFVHGLGTRQRPVRARPAVVALDQTRLDLLAAKHQDVVGYFLRDQLAEAAQNYRLEDALNMSHDDIIERVSSLAQQADALDLDWRWDWFTENGRVGRLLVPKHALAAERSPITITLNTRFGPEHADLRRQLMQTMGYGAPGEVDIPAEVVTSFEVEGPPLVAHRSENVSLTWRTATPVEVGQPFTLTFTDADCRHVASFAGKTTWTGGAHLGSTVHVAFYGAVTLKFQLPRDRTKDVTMNASIALAGCDPNDVVRGLSILEHLDSEHSVQLDLDGGDLGRLLPAKQDASVFGDMRDNILTHKDVAADLVVLQQATNQFFGYPDSVDPVDRVFLRCLRLLVEGRCIVMPDMHELTQTMNGKDSPELRQILAAGPSAVRGEMNNFSQEVFGRTFQLGPARMYAPQVEAVDADKVVAALEAGTAEGTPLTLRTVGDYSFWLYLDEKFIPEADDTVRPVGLGLADLPDAPDVVRALEAPSRVHAPEPDDA